MDTITLIDEENVEHEFAIEAFLDVGENKYAVLIPQSDDYINEAVIMKFALDDNGEEVLCDIEDDEEWEKVADAYDEFAAEEYKD
jgi:uncharacterized protein YrzB (UPF0473 family)